MDTESNSSNLLSGEFALESSSKKSRIGGSPENIKIEESVHGLTTIGPWRWLILVGFVYTAIVLVSLQTCFGVLFGDFLMAKNVSSTKIAWILNVHIFLWYFCSMFAGPVCRHFSWRKTGCTYSICVAVAFVVIAIFPSPIMIFLMFSCITGPFGGMASIVCINSLPRYFPDKTGMATSIYLGGIACGQIIMPMLSRTLQNEYGFSGATLILAALLLNVCVSFALLRPIPKITITDNKSTPHSFKTISKDIFKHAWNNVLGIRHPNLFIITTSMALMILGFVNFVSLVPFSLINYGYSKEIASLAISATGAGNIMTRIVMVAITDKKWLNRRKLFIAGLASLIICGCVLPLSLDVQNLLFVMLVGMGMSLAIVNSLYIVILIDTVGINLYESGIAVTCLILSVSGLAVGPIIGFIRDQTSSYTAGMYSCVFLILLSLLIWIFMPCA